jgi:hypothetical protein
MFMPYAGVALPGRFWTEFWTQIWTEETSLMGDKIRGVIAMLAGAFGIVRGAMGFSSGQGNWKTWGLIAAGAVVMALGVWRFLRKPVDPTAELLK